MTWGKTLKRFSPSRDPSRAGGHDGFCFFLLQDPKFENGIYRNSTTTEEIIDNKLVE